MLVKGVQMVARLVPISIYSFRCFIISDGFVKTNKQIIKEARENKRGAIVLQGTVKNTGIKPGRAPDRHLWIFNVDKETDDNELRSYIAEGWNAKSKPISIRKWEPQYKEEF